MLAEMTASQLMELYTFFEVEAREGERHEINRENSNIARFFDVAEDRQKK